LSDTAQFKAFKTAVEFSSPSIAVANVFADIKDTLPSPSLEMAKFIKRMAPPALPAVADFGVLKLKSALFEPRATKYFSEFARLFGGSRNTLENPLVYSQIAALSGPPTLRLELLKLPVEVQRLLDLCDILSSGIAVLEGRLKHAEETLGMGALGAPERIQHVFHAVRAQLEICKSKIHCFLDLPLCEEFEALGSRVLWDVRAILNHASEKLDSVWTLLG